MAEENGSLLSVRNLFVEYQSGGEIIHAVNGVSFDLKRGSSLGLVGETGAGKTTIAKSIMSILPDHATKSVRGEIFYEGSDLLKKPEKELQKIRGEEISMVFQDPMTALNPVMKVGDQIAEGIRQHQGLSKAEARAAAVKMLETVGISEDRADEYPHQFSGGMKQRVVIAIALSCRPNLLIADEPTTALDVTIQAQVLDLIKNLKKAQGTSMILITHDLGVVADTCDYVAVVYAGKIVERGTLEEIYDFPCHPYTKGLFAAIPQMEKKVRRLSPIEGLPPNPVDLPKGCYFSPRCPYATDRCKGEAPQEIYLGGTHYALCSELDKEGKINGPAGN
ncbi:MAG: ABC transporter ATP-binding protein [Oscillospiraceae bacterium]|jgi:peptide/nickel transport system ATP-binding protein